MRTGKNLFQGQVRLYRSGTGQIHQVRITGMNMIGDNTERPGIGFIRNRIGMPHHPFIRQCHRLRDIIGETIQVVQ